MIIFIIIVIVVVVVILGRDCFLTNVCVNQSLEVVTPSIVGKAGQQKPASMLMNTAWMMMVMVTINCK